MTTDDEAGRFVMWRKRGQRGGREDRALDQKVHRMVLAKKRETG